MSKTVINTDKAPAAIGTYSQAIKAGNTVYLSGQIPLDPKTMELVEGFEAQAVQVFENLKAVAEAAGGSLKDIAKLNIFLTDLGNFATVNEVMSRYCQQPYPARAAVGAARCRRRSRWMRSWSSTDPLQPAWPAPRRCPSAHQHLDPPIARFGGGIRRRHQQVALAVGLHPQLHRLQPPARSSSAMRWARRMPTCSLAARWPRVSVWPITVTTG